MTNICGPGLAVAGLVMVDALFFPLNRDALQP